MLKRNLVKALTAVAAASSVAVLAAPAAPAEAARRSCGYISCTVYLNKSETSDFKDGLGIAAVPVAFIPVAGPWTAGAMGINTGLISIMANHGWCLSLKFRLGNRYPEQGFYHC